MSFKCINACSSQPAACMHDTYIKNLSKPNYNSSHLFVKGHPKTFMKKILTLDLMIHNAAS